jgi:glutamate/tyrosine decarboxylase-like PLP-dependent enzyme
MKLPEKGLTREAVLSHLDSCKQDDLDWQSGRVFGYVFDPGEEAMAVGKEAYLKFITENALDFTAFPSLMTFEKQIVQMALSHLNGPDGSCGNFTSGGTESILLAVKAARDHARVHKPHIKTPEMILPVTAHAAFHKAARYLDLKVVLTDVDDSFRADPEQMERAITPHTVLMVGSAPSYAHGVMDPIETLAGMARDHGILFHTDACVGGFMLPFFRELGQAVPPFDFEVPGVTSLSMDLHKYAYTPKGASLVLYRERNLRKYQIFACSHWTGYTIINNAVQSSRSGGPMAGAWAVLNYMGAAGYRRIARAKMAATQQLTQAIAAHKDLRLMAVPDFCMFSFTSETISIFHLIDEMNSRGWYIQPALSFASSCQNIHLSVNYSNVQWVDAFIEDLYQSIEAVRDQPFGELGAAIEKQFATTDPDLLSDREVADLLALAQIDSNGMPGPMAGINEMLNALPARLRERLLVEYTNMIF